MKAWREPEDVLWRLNKDDRVAEARVPANGLAELRIYTRKTAKGPFDLLFTQTLKDQRAVRSLAAQQKKEFEAQGWA